MVDLAALYLRCRRQARFSRPQLTEGTPVRAMQEGRWGQDSRQQAQSGVAILRLVLGGWGPAAGATWSCGYSRRKSGFTEDLIGPCPCDNCGTAMADLSCPAVSTLQHGHLCPKRTAPVRMHMVQPHESPQRLHAPTEVGGAGVKDDAELLLRGPQRDLPIVLQNDGCSEAEWAQECGQQVAWVRMARSPVMCMWLGGLRRC